MTKDWTYNGRPCKIETVNGRHWAGYTFTYLRGFTFEDTIYYDGDNPVKLIEVHGGLTYGPDESGMVGFDTGHSTDFNLTEDGAEIGPETHLYDREDEEVTVWRPSDVKEEVERLADQLAALEEFVAAVTDMEKPERE